MKTLCLFLSCLICSFNAIAQQWALQAGGIGDDEGNSIAADQHGHIYATGIFSLSASFGPTVLNSSGSYDCYLSKYDTSGNFIWAKRFGGGGSDYPSVIVIDNNGDIIIAGSSNSTSMQIGTITLSANNDGNYFLAKFDSSGNTIWATSNAGYIEFNDIAIDQQNNVDLIGTITGRSIFGTDTIIPYYVHDLGPQFNSPDIIVAQYTSDGILNWVHREGSHGTDLGSSIAVDPTSGSIYTTGGIDSAGYFGSTLQNTTNSTYGLLDAYIAKLDVSGNILWVHNYGGWANLVTGNMIRLYNHHLYFSGHFVNSVVLGQDTINGTNDTFIAMLDTITNFTWTVKTGGTWVTGLAIDNSGAVLFTGVFNYTAIFGLDTLVANGPLVPNGPNDAYTSKLDSDGAFLWTRPGGGISDDVSKSISLDQIGNAYITGRIMDTARFGSLTLIVDPYYHFDAFIAKYNSQASPSIITEIKPAPEGHLEVFPNPFYYSTTIQSTYKLTGLIYTLYNSIGQVVKQIKYIHNGTIILYRGDLPSGIYLLRLEKDAKVLATKKLLISD